MNDAPVNTVPGAQSVNEDTALPIAGVSVADVDGGTLTTTLTVTAARSTSTARRGRQRQRHRSRDHHRHGRPDQRGARGLSYPGNLDFNGPDTLTVTTSTARAGHRHGRRSPSMR